MILASPERIAEYTAQGWWGTRTLHAGFAEVAARHPQREAVVDAPNRADLTDGAPRRLTYAQLAEEVDQLAVRLWRLGLKRDDIVIVQLVNSVEQYGVYLACLKLGLIISPVPVQYREHELEQILTLTQARAVITATRVLKHAAAAMWVGLAQRHASLAHVLAYGVGMPAGAQAVLEAEGEAPSSGTAGVASSVGRGAAAPARHLSLIHI